MGMAGSSKSGSHKITGKRLVHLTNDWGKHKCKEKEGVAKGTRTLDPRNHNPML